MIGGIDLTTAAGADGAREQLRTLYTTLLTDGLTDDEQVIVGLIKGLLTGVDGVVSEAKADSEKAVADQAGDRQRAMNARKSKAGRDAALTDATGAAAFTNFLTGLEPALSALFSTFDVTTLSGIDAAKARLTAFAAELDGLSDEEVLARFKMTREDVTGAILDLDSGLDGLASTARTTADAMREAAASQAAFADSVSNDLLRARGDDRAADLQSAAAATAGKLAQGKALGVSDAVLSQITEAGALNVAAINRRFDDAEAAARARATETSGGASERAGGASPGSDTRSAFIASGVTAITEQQANRLTDYAASAVVILRDIAGMIRAAAGGALPALRVPVLPAGVGGFAGGRSGGGGVSVNLYISGPITGMSPESAGRRIVDQLLPVLDAEQFRAAGINAKNIGEPL